MLFEFYAGLGILTTVLFFCGFFGVPKQDRNTRLTLMAITMFLSFALVMASFQIEITNCSSSLNSTCYSYPIVSNTTGAYYGGMYNYSNLGWTFSMPNYGVYYNLTNFTAESLNGFTFSKNRLYATNTGTYQMMGSISAQFGNSGLYGMAISKNGQNPETDSPTQKCYSRITGTGGQTEVMSFCIMNLTAGDYVTLVVDDEANPAQDIIIMNMNLNVISIDPTSYQSGSGNTTCIYSTQSCSTRTYQELELVGFFLLLAVLSLIYVIMEYLGYLPTEQTGRSGLYGGEKQAPQGFGQA